MVNHKLLRLSATLLLIGFVFSAVLQFLHPGGGPTYEATFANYAGSSDWAAVHLGQFVSTAVLLAGLLVLYFALGVSQGTARWLGFFGAIAAGVSLVTGLSLVLLAIVIIASTARIPRLIGYIMGLSGLAYIAQGYGYGTGSTALSNFVTWMPSSLNYQFLIVVWAIWLLVSAWRRKESVQAAPA